MWNHMYFKLILLNYILSAIKLSYLKKNVLHSIFHLNSVIFLNKMNETIKTILDIIYLH